MKKLLLGLFLVLGLVGLAGCGGTYVSHSHSHVTAHHTPVVVHHYHAPVVVHHYHAPVIVHHHTTTIVHHSTPVVRTVTSRPTVSLRKR